MPKPKDENLETLVRLAIIGVEYHEYADGLAALETLLTDLTETKEQLRRVKAQRNRYLRQREEAIATIREVYGWATHGPNTARIEERIVYLRKDK